jgi:hypothetical protein
MRTPDPLISQLSTSTPPTVPDPSDSIMTFGAFFSSVRRSMADKVAAAARRGPIPPGGPAQQQPSTAPSTAPSVTSTRSASTQSRPAADASQAERGKEEEWNYLIIDVRSKS